jgi:hypothetical protein
VDRRLVALVLEPHRVSGKLETAWAVAGHHMGDRSLTVRKNIYGRRADVLRNKVAQNFKCSCKIVNERCSKHRASEHRFFVEQRIP